MDIFVYNRLVYIHLYGPDPLTFTDAFNGSTSISCLEPYTCQKNAPGFPNTLNVPVSSSTSLVV